MKTPILIVIGLLGVGCGKYEKQELTLEEKIAGTYEWRSGKDVFRVVFLEGGAAELYENGEKDREEYRWRIRGQQPPGRVVDIREEVHIEYKDGSALILRINPDYSLTSIAEIMDEKRRDYLKDEQKIIGSVR
jgi:hypothetical protein|tara:strand:- start:189 stop:587 length:399 start_codon:yes stop_codon:yes gene_type:complete